MREIEGKARKIRELLKGQKYAIDYYQREYKWETKQVQELLDDLTSRFLDDYQPGDPRKAVANYGHYFLGSIIVSGKDGANYIVDGQQRLTSMTLLLMFLRNLQRNRPAQVNIDELIYSEYLGEKSFNLQDGERSPAMEALFNEEPITEESSQPESVRNIIGRYRDISDHFPEELSGDALPYFIDWLIENVHLVEITAFSDEDAYTIFETMNDRGLSLSPTDMLKGFLLAKITDELKRNNASDLWKQRTQQLRDLSRETEADFFKAWLRSQYAERIRERKKGARAEDFEKIGTEFHRWVREHATDRDNDPLTLRTSDEFFSFIRRDFDFYSNQYLRLMTASKQFISGLEHVLYNAWFGFTLQYMVLLAPLRPDDSDEVSRKKIRLAAMYLDIMLAQRIWNFRTIAYSAMQYTIFLVMRDIRGLDVEPLAHKLHATLTKEQETFFTNDRLYMHQQNRWLLHLLLARMTDYVEQESGAQSRFLEYVGGTGKTRYEVEHIWANKPEEHTDEFGHAADFTDYRNRFGGLLLLPKPFNASYGALPYLEKLKHYNAQNLLARSLHPDCYDRNPGFTSFVNRTGLPFRSMEQFRKAELDERQKLYQALAAQVWNPHRILQEIGSD
jgi:uncharacterized protein with ParB-like and HNH nuclease domain